MEFFPSSFLAFVLFFAALGLITIFAGVKVVPQGSQWTVERFGRYTHTLKPGLGIIVPFLDRVGRKLNMMETVLDVPSQDVITKDNALMRCDGVVFFQVMDAPKAAYEVRNLMQGITNLALTNLRTVIGSMDLDEVLSKRDEINARLLTIVDAATNPWGVKVTRIEIKDLMPPRDITEAMARQLKADREKRADILNAQGDRESSILRAEGFKQAAILEAEGRKEATFRDAEAREREAEAEAKATDMVSKAVAGGNVQAINYFVAQKYVESLQAIASADNAKVIFMPLEASNVIGSIGGIAELAKEAMGGIVGKTK